MTDKNERARDTVLGPAEVIDDESGGEQEDDSLLDSITRNIRRGITPEQLEKEERSE